MDMNDNKDAEEENSVHGKIILENEEPTEMEKDEVKGSEGEESTKDFKANFPPLAVESLQPSQHPQQQHQRHQHQQ